MKLAMKRGMRARLAVRRRCVGLAVVVLVGIGPAVAEAADLRVSQGGIYRDGLVTYFVDAEDRGPDAAENVVLVHEVEAGSLIKVVETTQGTCESVGPRISCRLGTIEKDKKVELFIQVQPPHGPPLVATSSATSSTADADPENNRVALMVNANGTETAPGVSPPGGDVPASRPSGGCSYAPIACRSSVPGLALTALCIATALLCPRAPSGRRRRWAGAPGDGG